MRLFRIFRLVPFVLVCFEGIYAGSRAEIPIQDEVCNSVFQADILQCMEENTDFLEIYDDCFGEAIHKYHLCQFRAHPTLK